MINMNGFEYEEESGGDVITSFDSGTVSVAVWAKQGVIAGKPSRIFRNVVLNKIEV